MAKDSLVTRVIHEMIEHLVDNLTGISNNDALVGISAEDEINIPKINTNESRSKSQYTEDIVLPSPIYSDVGYDKINNFNNISSAPSTENSNSDPYMTQNGNLDTLGTENNINIISDIPPIF